MAEMRLEIGITESRPHYLILSTVKQTLDYFIEPVFFVGMQVTGEGRSEMYLWNCIAE